MPVVEANGKRVLFIHVPKTAGTWIEGLLRSYGPLSGIRYGDDQETIDAGFACNPQHFHAPMLERVYSTNVWEKENPFDYVFMSVRNPLDRAISEYKYRNRLPLSKSLRTKPEKIRHMNNWLNARMSEYGSNPFILDNHFRPQNEFWTFDADIWRLEDGLGNLKNALDEVFEKRGTAPASKSNVSNFRIGQSMLSPDTKASLEKFYADDFDIYRY